MNRKFIYFVMSTLILLINISLTAQTARVQVIHNSSDVAADPVDIYLNGTSLA